MQLILVPIDPDTVPENLNECIGILRENKFIAGEFEYQGETHYHIGTMFFYLLNFKYITTGSEIRLAEKVNKYHISILGPFNTVQSFLDIHNISRSARFGIKVWDVETTDVSLNHQFEVELGQLTFTDWVHFFVL